MSLDVIISVAISLVMIWLLMSIAVMQIQEWLAAIFALRSKELEGAIFRLLTEGLGDEFYEHPLVRGLYKDPSLWQKILHRLTFWDKKPLKARPSYIPSDVFARVTMDLVTRAGSPVYPLRSLVQEIEASLAPKDAARAQLAELSAMTRQMLAQPGLSAAALDSLRADARRFAQDWPQYASKIERALQMMDELARQGSDWMGRAEAFAPEAALALFGAGVASLFKWGGGAEYLAEAMQSLVRQVESYAQPGAAGALQLQTEIEKWFNNAMDRLSGWYKRKMQIIAFVLGIVLAVALNVDSVQLAGYLWKDPVLRDALTAYGTQYAQDVAQLPNDAARPDVVMDNLSDQLNKLTLPLGWQLKAVTHDLNDCAILSFGPEKHFGFPGLDENGNIICAQIANLPKSTDEWLMKILGLLLTGVAAAQGAPFWFDILKKLVNVRGAGTKPTQVKPVG